MKKITKLCSVMLLAVVTAMSAAAQEGPNENISPVIPGPTAVSVKAPESAFDFPNGLGAYLILSSKMYGGLEYMRWVNDRFGLQTQISLYWIDDTSSREFIFDLNEQFDLRLARFETKNFASILYAWASVGFTGSFNYSPSSPSSTTSASGFAPSLLAGFGFGFDLIFFRHLSVPIQMGYLGEFGSGSSDRWINFAFSTGIRYKF